MNDNKKLMAIGICNLCRRKIHPTLFCRMGLYTVYLKHFLKVVPVKLLSDQWNLRSAYVLKLTGLPTGTTVVNLVDVISATRAKSCIIPKGLKSYMPRPFTYLAFECEKDYNQTLETSFALGSSDLSC